ncbi:hypothetical protein HID58_055349 [Brassica napus]|uniref:Uncharacterized protein n=1 Tax=Brassica napus TaxID=3708 RepID=A0ABQ8AK57_BRANA|nr:hypothetical protein HID58_055349 [Brassica napus]
MLRSLFSVAPTAVRFEPQHSPSIRSNIDSTPATATTFRLRKGVP